MDLNGFNPATFHGWITFYRRPRIDDFGSNLLIKRIGKTGFCRKHGKHGGCLRSPGIKELLKTEEIYGKS